MIQSNGNYFEKIIEDITSVEPINLGNMDKVCFTVRRCRSAKRLDALFIIAVTRVRYGSEIE